jgi:K+-sensing histidine kinase KdpD
LQELLLLYKDDQIKDCEKLNRTFDKLSAFYKNLYVPKLSTINQLFTEITSLVEREKTRLKRDDISIKIEGDFFEDFEKEDVKKKKNKKQLGNIELTGNFVKTVISELIRNSIKYAWDKKSIKHKEITIILSKRLNLAIVDEDGMSIELEYGEHGKDLLQIQYNDNGEGFTDGQLEQLFKSNGISFHEQTKESLSGYGLWKIRKTINKLGGEIHAKKVELGACFEISLPFNTEL